MSNQLYQKVQRHVQEKEVASILKSIPGIIEAKSATTLDAIFPFERYEETYNRNREPDAKISLQAPIEDRVRWIDQLMARAIAKDEFYLSVSDYPLSPWVRLRVKAGSRWIAELLAQITHFDVRILSLDLSSILIIQELEWDCAAFINAYEVAEMPISDP